MPSNYLRVLRPANHENVSKTLWYWLETFEVGRHSYNAQHIRPANSKLKTGCTSQSDAAASSHISPPAVQKHRASVTLREGNLI